LKLHLNNKGVSLIELIIAMAISAIVLSMIMIFLSGATQGFRKTNDDVNLQLEAQNTINQISTLIMEANKIWSADNPEDKRYIIEGNSNIYGVIYKNSSRRLYLVTKASVHEAGTTTGYSDADNLLAEYVDNISIVAGGGKTVEIKLEFSIGKDSYTATRKVKLRNVTDKNLTGKDIEINPIS